MEVVTTPFAGLSVPVLASRWERPLPGPLGAGCGVLFRQGGREGDPAGSGRAVPVVDGLGCAKLVREGVHELLGEYGSAVVAAVGVAHEDFALFEIQVLDSQAESLEQPQASAVEERGGQARRAMHAGKDRGDFGTGENDGDTDRAARAWHTVQCAERAPENIDIEEQERVQRLILRGGGNASLGGQVREERGDLTFAQDVWVSAVVKEDESANPADIRLLRAGAVMVRSQLVSHAVE